MDTGGLRHLRRIAVLALAVEAGCIVHDTDSAYPLYPAPRLERDQVAVLLGAIATVDDRAVASNGSTFELLPGCHVVTTQTKLLAFDNSNNTPQGTVTGTLPPLAYAIHMKAGHTYAIERQIQTVGGNSADVVINARDVSRDGKSVELGAYRGVERARAACAMVRGF